MKLNHFEELPEITPTFNDLSECTSYFYEEFGKLDQSGMGPKSIKKMRKFIDKLFKKSLGLIKSKSKLQNQIDTAGLKETKANLKLSTKEFNQDYKSVSISARKALINSQVSTKYSIEPASESAEVKQAIKPGTIEGQIEFPEVEKDNQAEANQN